MEINKKNGYVPTAQFDKAAVHLTQPQLNEKHQVNLMPAPTKRKQERVVDSGYAWVVLAAAFMLNMFMAGQFGTLGIWLVEYLHYFNTSKAPITWIGASQMFAGYFLGVFNGVLMKRFSVRTVTMVSSVMVTTGYTVSAFVPKLHILYIFFGALSGIGFLNFYLAAIVAVQQYFDKKRAFATGIVSSGLSVGIFIWSPVTRLLIDKYSWQGALLIEGAIFLNGVVFGALLRPQVKLQTMRAALDAVDEENSNSGNQEGARKSRCACLRTFPFKKFVPFYVFLIGYFFVQIGHMTVYGYIPVKGDSLGISKSTISLLISIMGITGIFARPCIGLVGDCQWASRTGLVGLSATLVGVFAIISTQFKDFLTLAIYSGIFGFFSSGYMALYGPAIVDIVGLNNIEVTGGILMVSKGLANLCLHSTAGVIMDVTNDANSPFYIFGAAQAVGGVLVMCVPSIQRYMEKDVPCDRTYLSIEVIAVDQARDKAILKPEETKQRYIA